MFEAIQRTEAIPAEYPDIPKGLSTAAAALDADAIWHRIESYIAHRWTARQVIWTIEGPGDWEPDLTPATVSATEVWTSTAWDAVTLDASPLGGSVLPGEGPYRITASVGSGEPPAAVCEAFRRLAEYMAEDTDKHGVASYSTTLGGALTETYDRSPTWLAKAMQNSGAGDLLRSYRRA